jgi:crossover junction endodeoxyribonuclease RuvC
VRVLAIDPGTRRAGYAVFEVKLPSYTFVECGIVLVRGRDLPEKLLHVHRGIDRLLRRLRPGHVVIERPFVGKSGRDAMTLGAARGVCMLAAAARRIPVFDYAPSQVKKAGGGNGMMAKLGVQRLVQLQLGLRELPPADAADAIALALCHINRR